MAELDANLQKLDLECEHKYGDVLRKCENNTHYILQVCKKCGSISSDYETIYLSKNKNKSPYKRVKK